MWTEGVTGGFQFRKMISALRRGKHFLKSIIYRKYYKNQVATAPPAKAWISYTSNTNDESI